uniref:Predicted protein n=1 Tax=Hordeum vulgare subsp. vulgare TaxID=112509 RepID=F2CQR5_HORVV|nr:predicted protein [Hordeum vulgare subsp. vulgare]
MPLMLLRLGSVPPRTVRLRLREYSDEQEKNPTLRGLPLSGRPPHYSFAMPSRPAPRGRGQSNPPLPPLLGLESWLTASSAAPARRRSPCPSSQGLEEGSNPGGRRPVKFRRSSSHAEQRKAK